MKLLLVDDDADIRQSLRVGLELQWRGLELLEAADGGEALDLIERERPDLVLLDVGLPGEDGYAVLEQIRQFSSVPVIMVTARDQAIDKVRGLEAGADDYVAKPFDHLELMARIRAVLRRLDLKAPTERVARYHRHDVEIDTGLREVRVQGERVTLTPTEWRILALLVANAGWVVPYERFLTRVWSDDDFANLDSLRVFIRRVRAKLRDDTTAPRYIETVRGVGYRLLKAEP
ncbi:MAG TPA: response regulator transcription factor [Candidatus Limnocylindria bacterium]|nr:response regulator transcription factor [Candidatus Limnocylindria bacterium]